MLTQDSDLYGEFHSPRSRHIAGWLTFLLGSAVGGGLIVAGLGVDDGTAKAALFSVGGGLAGLTWIIGLVMATRPGSAEVHAM